LSSRNAFTLAGVVAVMVFSSGSLGCWEQMSNEWFPQMKRQPAVQTFEVNATVGAGQGLTPPEGAVPVGDLRPNVVGMVLAAQEALPNPVPASLESVKGGEALFRRYCRTCHGPEGRGNGPVAGAPFGAGPFGVVIPIGGEFSLADSFSDGHIFTTITLGRGRMPSYKRIPVDGRWDLINYIRVLNDRGAPR
jgi:mono/diheme cytochrome c family protein